MVLSFLCFITGLVNLIIIPSRAVGDYCVLLTIVDVVTFGGGHLFLEVGDACFHEDVVPGDELFDVAVVDALLIPLGEYLGEVGAEFVA